MKKLLQKVSYKNEGLFIALLWLAVTAFNFFKAFHIDDTFHLEAGKWIAQNWFSPLSGKINWANNLEYMYTFNQPVLFFYLVAVVGSVFSFTEVPMHILLATFSFMAIVFFHKIQRFLYPKSSLILMLLFFMCPAFLVNQNLMTDVPLLAFMLGFVYFLLRGGANGAWKNYALAGVFLSLGLLTKYTLLPLVLVFVLVLSVRQHFKQLLCLLIPVGTLVLWSVWNLNEYGSVHIFGREAGSFSLKSFGSGLLSYAGCLAAIVPVYCILFSYFRKKIVHVLLVISTLILVGLPVFYALNVLSYQSLLGILNMAFTLLGLVLLLHGLFLLVKRAYKANNIMVLLKSHQAVLLLCFMGMMLFVVLFAPFMATRHVMLSLPFLLWLYAARIERSSCRLKKYFVGVTLALGCLLGISDYQFAGYYKKLASSIPENSKESKVWTVGHWGWQWYSVQHGASIYNRDLYQVKIGDRIVKPMRISAQDIHPSVETEPMDSLFLEPTWQTFFAVHNHGSLYTSRYKKPAWTFSTHPVDTLVVFRVVGINFEATKHSVAHN